MPPLSATAVFLADVFLAVARRVDGGVLVREALPALPGLATSTDLLHVLALGKVAFPMLDGVLTALGSDRLAGGLLIAPAPRFPPHPTLPPGVEAFAADHPTPSDRSLAAGAAARQFVGTLGPNDHLLALVSGGGSALMVAPAGDLTLDEKRATTTAVARGGATIHQLNTVRKHLSAVKGGQLALATQARVTVLALSDVVGNDPGTIASGPFSPDPTTYAEALALVLRLAPEAPPRAVAWLERGAAGGLPETPKPGDRRLARVTYHVLAGPDRVPAEARALVEAGGRAPGLLARDTEQPVEALAAAYADRARHEAGCGGRPRVFIGNGEPSIVVRGNGQGGRCTHLALLVAREIAGQAGVTFLAAGTDDRDGSADASGAVVDGSTWSRALAAGFDPEAALAGCDSAPLLGALGCLVRGPGTSNLLDLHLLAVDG